MHYEQELIVCRLQIADRLREAEQLRLVRAATSSTAVWQRAAARVGGVLVRVGQWLQTTGEARQATAAGV